MVVGSEHDSDRRSFRSELILVPRFSPCSLALAGVSIDIVEQEECHDTSAVAIIENQAARVPQSLVELL